MSGARALVAAVPQRVWTAVAGLVLLASLGVALVLGAGLSTWQGGVDHAPAQGAARPPATVVSPPRGAVIVVPTPKPPVAHPAPAPGQAPATGGPVTAAVPAPLVLAPPVLAPPALAPGEVAAVTTMTARPRTAASTALLPHTAPGRAVGRSEHAVNSHDVGHGSRHHGNHGKHLGWTKGVRAGSSHGRNG